VKSALLLFCSGILLLSSDASSADSIGRITSVSGDVVRIRPGVAPQGMLKSGDTIQVADLLKTGKNGRIRVLLSSAAIVSVMPGSALRISQYTFDRGRDRMSAVVSLKEGMARFILYKEMKGGSSLKIETDQALAQTSLADVVADLSGGTTALYTLAGSISVRNCSRLIVGTIRVGENQSVTIQTTSPPTSPSVIPLQQRRKFNKDARQF